MRVISLAVLGFALASPAIAAQPSQSPSQMSPAEIKAHNAGLESTDLNYIKCRKTEVLGSLAKKQRTCRTNQQWKDVTAAGNDGTREMVEGFARSGGSSGN